MELVLAAIAEGRFKREIVPMEGVEHDETPRQTSLEKMAELEGIFGCDKVTAGVSSQTCDAASAMLIVSEDALKRYNLSPRARICLGLTFHFQPKAHIVENRHMRKERIVLKDHPNSALVRRDVVDRVAVKENLSVRRRLKPRQHHETRGLSRPRRSEHRQKLALADGQIQVLYHEDFSIVALLYPVEYDEAVVAAI